jgi:hypothetical protein
MTTAMMTRARGLAAKRCCILQRSRSASVQKQAPQPCCSATGKAVGICCETPLMQEPFASGQQLACDGVSDGSNRRPWWLPLAHITGGASGDGVTPSSWVVLDDCSTGDTLISGVHNTTSYAHFNTAMEEGGFFVQEPGYRWRLSSPHVHGSTMPHIGQPLLMWVCKAAGAMWSTGTAGFIKGALYRLQTSRCWS